jgi:hypothetical protein
LFLGHRNYLEIAGDQLQGFSRLSDNAKLCLLQAKVFHPAKINHLP